MAVNVLTELENVQIFTQKNEKEILLLYEMYIQIRSLKKDEVCFVFSTSDSPSGKMYNFSKLSCPQMCNFFVNTRLW